MNIETSLIRTQTAASCHREHASSIYMTSSFTFNNAEQARAMFAKEEAGSIYTRYGNPNVDEFVEKMCILEKAEAGVAVASGMSAMFSALAALLDSGDHVLASRSVFGTTHKVLTQVLPRWGITTSFAPLTAPETWAALVQPNTKICVVETPSNPTLDLVDLAWLGSFCRQRNIILLVDNVFATPLLQNPISYGANIVMHSTTKYIDGQGRGVGGVLVGDAKYIDKIYAFTRSTGPAMSPFNAWMFSKSLETLPLRIDRHCDNAEKVAAWLETQSDVVTVKYPHLPSHPQYELAKRQMRRGGGIVTFEVAGGLAQGRCFLDAIQMCSLTANLGDSRTTVTHPASTTHAGLSETDCAVVGITPGLIRVSVGLEHHEDIIADIAQALQHSRVDTREAK